MPTAASLLPNAQEGAAAHPRPQQRRPLARPEARQGTAERPKRPNAAPKPTGFQEPPRRESRARPRKAGHSPRAETARRRLIVEDLTKAGLSIRMIAGATDISRSAVHRAMMAIAKAEAKKELAVSRDNLRASRPQAFPLAASMSSKTRGTSTAVHKQASGRRTKGAYRKQAKALSLA